MTKGLEITSDTSKSSSVGSSSDSSSSSSSSSVDNDDLIYDATYVPLNANSESDSDGEAISNAINCNINNADIGTITSVDPSLGSTLNASNVSNTLYPMILTSPLKKLVKLRNSGKAYEMHTTDKKVWKERKMGSPCTEKCKVKYFTKVLWGGTYSDF